MEGCNIREDNSKENLNKINTENENTFLSYWCPSCKTPIILKNTEDTCNCSLCNSELSYMASDLRPVFPEERLLLEILLDKPLAYIEDSVWVTNNRYIINGESIRITDKHYKKYSSKYIIEQLEKYKKDNTYDNFNLHIDNFVDANMGRLNFLESEAFDFVQRSAKGFNEENIVISFSGGKDSTVTADVVTRGLSNPSLVHIFGNTTLEFPLTLKYAKRFREDNPYAIFKTAENKDQNFMDVCKDIGPPARMMRWCCSMFKTGPITRVINSLYGSQQILTFYGIRKSESVSRSKYNRVEDNPETVKILQQTVASPIFYWKDIDIWLYLLANEVDFNDAYRLGYDRVGCWCCPNNNTRAQFLSDIYMPEKTTEWRNFLVDFAKRIGKPDPEVYVDTGKWKARQGGNGVKAAEDVKIKSTNCTAEEHAKIYELKYPVDDDFLSLFNPFGKIATELGRKIINETVIVDIKTKMPVLSIQPFTQDGYEYSVKIKIMNVNNVDEIEKKVAYQVRKFNACRKCLKCESVCKFGAIYITADTYRIDGNKCTRCKKCVTSKYLGGGCMMDKYLKTKAKIKELEDEQL